MNIVIAHSTLNIKKVTKAIKEIEFNSVKGGFNFQNENLGKGPSEFMELILLLTKSFSSKDISEELLDKEICNKFCEYHLIQQEKDFGVRAVSYTHLTLPTICSV